MLIAYHDIGKSISAATYDTNRNRDEIIYSYPIAWRLMLNSGFNMREAKLAILLIHVHKLIGAYLQNKISKDKAKLEFFNNAKVGGMAPDKFFRLAEILFVSDAGSYPNLKEKIFDTDPTTGKMTPNDQWRIEELRTSILEYSQEPKSGSH